MRAPLPSHAKQCMRAACPSMPNEACEHHSPATRNNARVQRAPPCQTRQTCAADGKPPWAGVPARTLQQQFHQLVVAARGSFMQCAAAAAAALGALQVDI
eukprot:352362-Chlamydomonas_euryale.AAC.7